MNKKDYIRNRVKDRQLLLERIVKVFKSLYPVAIHLFGSGTYGYKDEFSDIDIWVTFYDDDARLTKPGLVSLGLIAPVLVKHHSKTWSPIGGSAYSVIHETPSGLFIVDYYISKRSETVIKEDSMLLHGDDSLPRGEWKLNRHVDEKMRDNHTLRKDIDLLLDLICIGFKGIVRGWEDDQHIQTLRLVHKNFRERYEGVLPPRRLTLTFASSYRLLDDLAQISNKRQKRAAAKIKAFGKQIEKLYF